jgi:hypothetical protein
MRTRMRESRLDSGSSNRNTCGLRTIARPIATRWRWPPDRSLGLRCSRCSMCSSFAAFCTSRSISAFGTLAELQAEGHVVVQAHVRIQRVALEHHRDAALRGRHVVDDAAADAQFARR